MGSRGLRIGRAKGNIMPIHWMGVVFQVPLSRNYRGKRYREYSFSPTKAISRRRAKELRDKGDRAFVKTFTASSKRHPRYKKTIYVVYRRK